MRLLLVPRPEFQQHTGGDVTQQRAIERWLRARGHQVTFDPSPLSAKALRAFDAVHLFNLNRPFELEAWRWRCRRAGVPYILAPIYWDMRDLWPPPPPPPGWKRTLRPLIPAALVELRDRSRRFRREPTIAHAGWLTRSVRGMMQRALQDAAVIVPNSHAEWAHLRERFPAARLPAHRVVYNGCNPVRSPGPELFRQAYPELSKALFVACVAHIGPRKNQRMLVKAARDLSLRIVLIGEENDNHEGYGDLVREASSRNVVWLGRLAQPMILSCLENALAHALPSYIETPGLASLEAASVGCPIIVGDCAPVRETFGLSARYVNPDDDDAIHEALIDAIEGRLPHPDGPKMSDSWSWERVLSPYETILGSLAPAN